MIQGIQGEQPGQRVAGEAPPGGNAGKLRFRRRQKNAGQQRQIFVGACGAGRGIFKYRRMIPGNHVVVPVQTADDDQ